MEVVWGFLLQFILLLSSVEGRCFNYVEFDYIECYNNSFSEATDFFGNISNATKLLLDDFCSMFIVQALWPSTNAGECRTKPRVFNSVDEKCYSLVGFICVPTQN
jgi:hypothetical protein